MLRKSEGPLQKGACGRQHCVHLFDINPAETSHHSYSASENQFFWRAFCVPDLSVSLAAAQQFAGVVAD